MTITSSRIFEKVLTLTILPNIKVKSTSVSRWIMKSNHIIILLVLLLSCAEKNRSAEVETIYVPDRQSAKLSDFVSEIEYYTLPKDIYSGFFDNVIGTENHFIFADYDMEKKVYILDKNFELVAVIDNYGEGPGEYQWIVSVVFNRERKTVEILSRKHLIRFSLKGEYLESIKLPFVFGNLAPLSKDRYIAYNQYLSAGYDENSYLVTWDSDNNEVTPMLYHEKNITASSYIDKRNMFYFDGYVYATHIFMDTIYKIDQNKEISKLFIDLPKESLPLEYLEGDSDHVLSVLNDETIGKTYSYHSPRLMVSKKYLIDGFEKDRLLNFFILNKSTEHVVSVGELVNDIDSGVEYIIPQFIDQSGNFYTIYDYEPTLEYAKEKKANGNSSSPFIEFVESLDPETGFIVMKFKLKDF